MNAAALQCRSCGITVAPHDRWCVDCGSALVPLHRPVPDAPIPDAPAPEPPADPDATLIALCPLCKNDIDEGYCSRCGAPAGELRDHHAEVPSTWMGGVSDRGLRHHRNEDALALASDPVPCSFGVMVVCDGVSSSQASDVASQAAARAARAVLSRQRGPALQQAVTAANDAIDTATAAQLEDADASAPACTFVAAVIERDTVTVGNIGDSRAYWLGDDNDARLLTTDDSMAQMHIAMGVERAVAEQGPQAHAITRWLGPDAPDLSIDPHTFSVPGDGWLLLCSDGLWNYATEPHEVLRVVQEAILAGRHDPKDLAAHLVRWACDQGGHDNVTVALARFGPRQDPGSIVLSSRREDLGDDTMSGAPGHTGP